MTLQAKEQLRAAVSRLDAAGLELRRRDEAAAAAALQLEAAGKQLEAKRAALEVGVG